MKKQSLIGFVRNIPISKRIVLLVLLVSIVPILIANIFGYYKAYNAVQNTAVNYNLRLLDSLNQNIVSIANSGSIYLDELITESAVRNTVIHFDELDALEKNKAILSIRDIVRGKSNMIRYLYDLRIVTADNRPVYTMGRLFTREQELVPIFEKIRDHKEIESWFLASINNRTSVVLARKIIHIGTGEVYGYVMLYIDPKFLTIPSGNEPFDRHNHLTLMDSFGELLSYSDGEYTEQELRTFQAILNAPKGQSGRQYSGDADNFVCYSSVPKLGWTLVSSTPISYLMQPIESMKYTTIVLAVLLIFLCILISRLIINSITVPLNNMLAYIDKASDLKFESELIDNNTDELGYLAQAYNKICRRIRELVIQIEVEQDSKRQAEIKMLQAQINPHFLFNTLDSLRFAAMMSNAPSVSAGLSALSHLLRNSILRSDSFISLKQEVSDINDYLTIQKIRHGDVITLNTQMDSAAEHARIMKLLLQPIVENSVIHGLREDAELVITLSAQVEARQLCIVLQDNGRGFDPARGSEQQKNGHKGARMSGVGLENVRERLQLEYKDCYQFTLESRPGAGTIVTIRQPYVETD